jgi:hypothetical protein
MKFMLPPLYSRGKDPKYPFDRRLDGLQNQSGRRGEERIYLPGLELRSFCCPARGQSELIADHSHPSSAYVKYAWNNASIARPTSFSSDAWLSTTEQTGAVPRTHHGHSIFCPAFQSPYHSTLQQSAFY